MKRPSFRRIAGKLVRMVVAGYVLLCGLTYLYQSKLVFPGADFQGKSVTSIHYGAGAEVIHLMTKDGVDLAAAVHVESTTRPAVLFFYGNGGSVAWSVNEFDHLVRLGMDVVVVDYPGFGASGGKPTEAGFYQAADAAYDYLTITRGVPPARIVAVGWSLGGAVAIDLASRRPVAGLVTLNAFANMSGVAHQMIPWMPTSLLLKYKFDNLSKMPAIQCPALIVNGTEDRLVDPAMSDRLAAAAGGPVTRLVVEGADHNSIFDHDPKLVYGKLDEFIRNATDVKSMRPRRHEEHEGKHED